MALMEVGLDDKYRLDAKRIFLSGTQALVRLPMLQRERDRAQGLNTAGFISGYRGSPLGMYDHALWRAKSFLKATRHRIRAGPQRGPGGDRGVGQPAGRHVPRCQGRWRVRHLVRQGPRRRPLAGCAQACQLGRHLAERRRDRARRRRPWLPVLDARPSERTGVRVGPDADRQSGDAAGLSRSRHPRLRAVALFQLLGRLQGDLGDGRKLGLDRQRSRSHQDHHARRFRDAARRARHPLARCAAGAGAPAARPEDGRGRRLHPRQPFRPHRAGFQAGAARHHGDRQGLSRSAAGAGRSRHYRQRSAGAGTAHLQGGADLAAGAVRRPRLRRRLAGRAGRRGEARLHRGPAAAHSLQRRRIEAALGGRQARRDRRHAAAERRRIDADHDRGCRRGAPAQARPSQPRAGAASGQARGVRPAGRGHCRGEAAAHAVFLFGLPAQHFDQGARRQPRHGRHRLSRHGAVDARPAAPRPSRIWVRKASHGSGRRRSPANSMCSRIWATAPTPIPACWRCARRRRPASTSPTRSSTTTRWR